MVKVEMRVNHSNDVRQPQMVLVEHINESPPDGSVEPVHFLVVPSNTGIHENHAAPVVYAARIDHTCLTPKGVRLGKRNIGEMKQDDILN